MIPPSSPLPPLPTKGCGKNNPINSIFISKWYAIPVTGHLFTTGSESTIYKTKRDPSGGKGRPWSYNAAQNNSHSVPRCSVRLRVRVNSKIKILRYSMKWVTDSLCPLLDLKNTIYFCRQSGINWIISLLHCKGHFVRELS